jgi:Tol biopolymer transport system component
MQASGASDTPAMSADGRYIAFTSSAANLVPGDTNGGPDVFIRDLTAGTTVRVSVAGDGTQTAGASDSPTISADGRYVAFRSDGSNLVPGDTNGVGDVFVRDLTAGTTTRVSVATDGSQANGLSDQPAISGDGRWVAYRSAATTLVHDTNGRNDIFLTDRQAMATIRISVSSAGAQGAGNSSTPSISNDGHFVAFASGSFNLLYSGTNGLQHIFVYDRVAAATNLVSVATSGAQGNGASSKPRIDGDGNLIVFQSDATNLVPGDTNGAGDVFLRDIGAATTTRVSVGPGGVQAGSASDNPTISVSGRTIAFQSNATNLVPGDTNGVGDVFAYDRQLARLTRVDVANDGSQANNAAMKPALGDDGRYVSFRSTASNLVTGDSNNTYDVFWRDQGSLPSPDLAVSVHDMVDPVLLGASETYHATVTNNGNAGATGVVVADPVPGRPPHARSAPWPPAVRPRPPSPSPRPPPAP